MLGKYAWHHWCFVRRHDRVIYRFLFCPVHSDRGKKAGNKRAFSSVDGFGEVPGSNKRPRTSSLNRGATPMTTTENDYPPLPEHLRAVASYPPSEMIEMIFFNMQFLSARPPGSHSYSIGY